MPNNRKIRMPRGKYYGVFIDELPTSYLKWIAENWAEDTPENKAICKAADNEYQERTNGD